jgi:hypothetical protein
VIVRFATAVAASLLAMVCALSTSMAAVAPRTTAAGEFVDSANGHHPWRVNENHALYWESKPFTPIGAVLASKFLSSEPTDDNWQADIKALRALKKNGVTNILIRPGSGPGSIVDLPASTVQGLLDVLDSSGFTYGFDIDGAPRTSWTAALINPAIYRSPAPEAGSTVSFRNLPDIVSATYFLVNVSDGHVAATGNADIVDNLTVSVKLSPGQGGDGTVLLLYPEARMTPGGDEERSVPDIWAGADEYRDSILLYFNRVKFGKGLRFFLDPVRVDSALVAQADGGMLPTSDTFRIQFQSWLLKRYGNSLVRLRASWGVKNNDIPDFATAVRCRPLWFQAKGLPLLYDPTNAHTFEILPANSHVWQDIRDFQIESIQRAMNGIADALKTGVANVPVVYTWSQLSPAFVNLGPNGYDGLFFNPRIHGDAIVREGGAYAFAAVEQSRRTQWFAARVPTSQDALPDAITGKGGNVGRSVLTADRTAVESIGAKAFYADTPANPTWDAAGTEWLGWLRSDAAARSVDAANFASSKPGTIFYPLNLSLPNMGVQRLTENVWWLPTFQSGYMLDLGSKLAGYGISNSANIPTFVVWSPTGQPLETRFKFPKGTNLEVRNVNGDPIAPATKKGATAVTFISDPYLLSGAASLPLPEGAAEAELAEATRLAGAGADVKIPMEAYMQRLYYIKNTLLRKSDIDPMPAYQMVREILGQIKHVLVPYVWIEGEGASLQNFESVVASPDASGRSFLWLDTNRDPAGGTSATYRAMYRTSVNAPGEYSIWAAIAPGPPGSASTSPILLRVDDQPPMDVTRPLVAGKPYGSLPFPNAPTGGAFIWCNLGSAQLTSGQHRVTITIAGRAGGTNRYTLGIDALVLSRTPFKPDGAQRPAF